MSIRNTERNASQFGIRESNIRSDSAASGDSHLIGANTDANVNINRNPSSSDPSKNSTSTALEQLQRYGATNAHLVNLGRKQLKAKGLAAFEEFNKSAGEVDAALRRLGSSMQLLGSSVGVIHAIYQLRKALLRLVFYFRENAARLYESSVKPNEKRYACEVKPEMKVDGRINKHDLSKRRDSHRINLDKRPNGPGILGRNEHDKYEPNKAMENKRYGDIVGSMGQVGEVLVAFVKRINEISGFQDELINQTFSSFAKELEYRVGAFERLRYTRNEGFNEHINILAVVFGQYLSDMHQALKGFQKNSIPIIQRAQEHRQLGLQGLSAMATFFSGITASTLQYQLNNSFAPLESVVNGLWIMSLACSVASAVSAQVIYFWCSSRSSSPDKYTPGVIGRVLKHTPVVYLTCSVSTFMVGLSVFTFSSGQHVVISVLIAVFTGVVSFKLVAFGLWITLERLTYSWTGGGHWFLQVHSHVALEIPNYMINKVKRLAQPQATTPEQSNSEPSSAIERGISHKLPLDSTLTSKPPGGILSPARRKALKEFTLRKKLDAFKDQYPPPDTNWRRGAIHITHADKQAYINNFELLDVVWQHKGLIKHLAFNPNDQSLLATCGWDGTAVISYIDQKSGKSTIASKFILSYDKNTQNLSPIQPQGDQQLLISPQLSNKEISVREEIRVKEEACVREVTWSLDGKKLATRTRKTVRIWDSENGNLLETIRASANEPCTIEGIAWTTQGTGSTNEQNNGENSRRKTKHDGGKEHHGGDNGGDDSASIEKNGNRLRDESKNKDKKDKTEPLLLILEHICKVDQKEVGSTAICRYRQDPTGSNGPWVSISRKIIENAKIISIGVVNDSLLVAVGIDTGGDPKNEAEKFMFLYNFVQGEVMRITPLTGAVRNISVTTSAKNTAAILVTYKHQGAYPQLWRIKLTNPYSRDHSTLSKSYCDFTYVQSYFSKETSDFSGRGGFGGLDNGYVCCSSQGGEIFVWDRITGLLVGTINPANDEHIKFFACNKQACPDFKCASGAVDGILSLWTANVRNAEYTSSPPPLNTPGPDTHDYEPIMK